MRRRRRKRKKWIGWGVIGLLFGVWGYWVIHEGNSALPAQASSNPRVRAAYLAADRLRNHPALDYIPCYCGCGRQGHKSIRSCFLKGKRGYDVHGAFCDICQDIMLMVDQGLQEGLDVATIRQKVDLRYTSHGLQPTPTPKPPANL